MRLACCIAVVACACGDNTPRSPLDAAVDPLVGTWETLRPDGQLAPPVYDFRVDGVALLGRGGLGTWQRIDLITIQTSTDDCTSGECQILHEVVANDILAWVNPTIIARETTGSGDALAGSSWTYSAHTVLYGAPDPCLGTDWQVLTLAGDGTFEIDSFGPCASHEAGSRGTWIETAVGFDLGDAPIHYARMNDTILIANGFSQRVTFP